MSTLNFLAWAFDAPVETPAELAVLLVVANSADQDGNITISRQKLADKARMRVDRLDQALVTLEEGGFIGIFDPHDWSKIGVSLKVTGQ